MMTPIAPAEPPAPWIGGKRHLAQRICKILAATTHDAYAEPFIGMGGVFLRRAQRPRVEILNDASGDVVNLFRILQRHPEALLRELRWRPAMRVEFDRLKGAPKGHPDEVRRPRANPVTNSEIKVWFRGLTKAQKTLGVLALWALAKEHHPGRHLPRKLVEQFGQDRGNGHRARA